MVLHHYANLLAYKLVSLFHPIRIVNSSDVFSRVSRQVHVFISSVDWFIGLSVSSVIG